MNPRWLAVVMTTSLLMTQSACSVLTVKRPTTDLKAQALTCTQSNWAAGVDMVLGAAGAIATSEARNESVFPALLATSGALASMVYGFHHTLKCRDRGKKLNRSVSGGYDWLYAPGIVVVIVGIVAMANAGGSLDPDLCEPGEKITALCNDGVYSCSKTRSGTCSWHQGVYVWYFR